MNQPVADISSRRTSKCFYTAKYVYKQISTDALQSSQPYQRPVRAKRVMDIVENFNPLYLDEIIVSYRDGKYYVVDGQNRIVAFRQMNGGRHCLVNCKVFYGLSYEDEATMFHHLDGVRGRLKFCDKVRASFEARDNPDIQNISSILHQYGVTWAFTGTNNRKSYTISASQTLLECYQALGPFLFEQVIRLIVMTWGGRKETLTSHFIKGVSLFVRTYVHEADEKAFIKKLSGVSPGEVNSLASQEVSAGRVDLKYARVFLTKYNHKVTPSKRLSYKFTE